jgi:hypothetical protein
MTISKRSILLALATGLLLNGCNRLNTQTAAGLDFHVNPLARDGGDGSSAAPFQTLEQARDAIRRLDEGSRKNEINVWLGDGEYRLTETLVLNRQDGGRGNHRVRYRALPGATPVLTSGKPVNEWEKLSAPVERLPAAAQEHVWVADVSREDYGRFTTLFMGDKRLPRAKSARFQGEKPTGYEIADSRNVMHKKDRHLLREIRCLDGAPIRQWTNLDDIEVFFNPVPWALNFIPLERVDMEQRLLTLKYEANAPAFSQNGPYAWIENAVDFIDEPGEWAHNSETGKLYYWPIDGKKPGNILVPQLHEFIRVEGDIHYDAPADQPVSNISFEGLTFTHGKRSNWYKGRKGWGIQHDWDTFDYGNAMLRLRGAENIEIKGNHFTNSGGSAIRLDLHAQNNTISNNLINYVGHMGILLAGYGPGTKDVNHHNTIHNNIIHHVGEIIWHGHAIFVWQSGSNVISHNWIHDVPRKAVGICGVRVQILMKYNEDFDEAAQTIRWNEIDQSATWTDDVQAHFMPYLHARNNIIEHNKVTRTLLQLSDGGSINVSGAGEGNIVRHNYVYDVDYIAVRTDDWQRGTTTTQNIIVRAGTGVVHKDYNHIINNIFIDLNGEAIRMRAFPRQVFVPDSIMQRNIVFSSRKNPVPPYGERDLWNSDEFKVGKAGTKPLPYEYKLDHNLYWFDGADAFLAGFQKKGIEQHSIIADPKFTNIGRMDLRLDAASPALTEIGFEPFDVKLDSFGITKDYPAHLLKKDSRLTQWGEPSESAADAHRKHY